MMVRKFFLGLLLVGVGSVAVGEEMQRAKPAEGDTEFDIKKLYPVEVFSNADLAVQLAEVAKKIVECERNLTNYHAGSFASNTAHVVGYSAFATAEGALTALAAVVVVGLAQQLMDRNIGPKEYFPAFVSQAVQTSIAGILMGVWGLTGSKPRLSWSKMMSMMFVHQVVSKLLLGLSLLIANTENSRVLLPRLSQVVALGVLLVELSHITKNRTDLANQRTALMEDLAKLQKMQNQLNAMKTDVMELEDELGKAH